MIRKKTVAGLLKKKFKTYQLDGVWMDVLGKPEQRGVWLVYGAEKHGKTWFTLLMSEYLSRLNGVLYVSAEEGESKSFVDAIKRAKLDEKNKSLRFTKYLSLEELDEELKKRRSAPIIIIDNVTVYQDELKYGGLRKLIETHPNKLFIFVAHEERNEPYTSTAKMVKRLSDIIVRVEGLACFISGRCPGGILTIDEEKATLYHGTNITNKT